MSHILSARQTGVTFFPVGELKSTEKAKDPDSVGFKNKTEEFKVMAATTNKTAAAFATR
jgi:hypothetical protein